LQRVFEIHREQPIVCVRIVRRNKRRRHRQHLFQPLKEQLVNDGKVAVVLVRGPFPGSRPPLEYRGKNLADEPGQDTYQQPATDARVAVHDANVQKGREALSRTADEFLMTTNWRLLAGGQVVLDQPRHVVLRDTLNHLAHHRGQLTVYLRLTDRTVPSIYGPSADDQRFA
jgi:DinB family